MTRISVDHGHKFGRHEFPSPRFQKGGRICSFLMQNLLETYGEDSQSSHISIENDDLSIVIDSDVEKQPKSVQVSSKPRNSAPKPIKGQSEIRDFFGRKQTSQADESALSKRVPSNKSDSSKKWKDWKADATKEKKRKREQERRKKHGGSNTDKRRARIINHLIDGECERFGTDISVEQNKAEIAA